MRDGRRTPHVSEVAEQPAGAGPGDVSQAPPRPNVEAIQNDLRHRARNQGFAVCQIGHATPLRKEGAPCVCSAAASISCSPVHAMFSCCLSSQFCARGAAHEKHIATNDETAQLHVHLTTATTNSTNANHMALQCAYVRGAAKVGSSLLLQCFAVAAAFRQHFAV